MSHPEALNGTRQSNSSALAVDQLASAEPFIFFNKVHVSEAQHNASLTKSHSLENESNQQKLTKLRVIRATARRRRKLTCLLNIQIRL